MTRPLKWIAFLAATLAAAAAATPVAAQDKGQTEAEETLSAIVRIKTKIIKDARSAETLGLRRDGSGVLIRDGYVLTIGYLVIEAESIEVTAADGTAVPAAVAGYDHATGFGLLRLLAPLAGKPLPLGEPSALAEREAAMIASHGGREGVNLVYVVSRRPFTGSWEYLLDSAIFTYPAVMNWSGAALISAKGELLGIGSLIVTDSAGAGSQAPGNMFVPVDLLKPILDDLIASGRRSGPARPWLGLNAEEMRGRLLVARVSPEGPAARAGLKSGDIVIGVAGEEVNSLPDLYRKVWARGAAGVDVPLKVLQGLEIRDVTVRSIDRLEYFSKDPPTRLRSAGLSNQPLTEEERMQLEARILALDVEHHDLDDVIARLVTDPRQDELQLRRLKKRKLLLKDTIARLRDRLIPDIIA